MACQSCFVERLHCASRPWADSSSKLHVSLIPIPYVGNPLTADIIILMLNPGFLPISIWAEDTVPNWSQVLWRNLRQERAIDCEPFLFLDPQFAWHPGFTYWAARFRKTVVHIMETRGIPYHQALKWLSQRVACLQLVPYASSSFGLPSHLIQSLPSVQQAKQFVHETLLPQVTDGKKLLIVARQAKT